MRDNQRGAVVCGFIERRLDGFFGVGIERGGCFVKHQNRCVFQQSACNRHALFFPAGNFQPALTHLRVQTFGQACQKPTQMRGLRRRQHLCVTRIGAAIANVVAQRVVEQHRILRHDADGLAQAFLRHGAHRLTINQNIAALRVIKSKQ